MQHRTDREKQDLAYPYVVSECSISVKVNPTVAGKTEKPWQTSITFLERVKTLNNEMKKKIQLKNCSSPRQCNDSRDGLKLVKHLNKLLPPNMTSHLQPYGS